MTTPVDVAKISHTSTMNKLMEENASLTRELTKLRDNMKRTVREVRHRALSTSLRNAAYDHPDADVRAWLIERAERIESEEPEP